MDIYAQIKQYIKEIQGKKSENFLIATINSINGEVCEIIISEDLKITGVRLRSVVNQEDSKILITPKIGSKVLLADLSGGNLTELVIIAYSEIEKIEIVTNSIKITNLDETLTVELDGEAKKIDIKNDTISLKDIMQQLADIINQLTVATPAGPSGTPLPPTIQAVTQFTTDFKKLLK